MDIATAAAKAPATATSTPANQRIVVQATEFDKRAIVAKAKKLDMPISELMRRGAFAYQSDESDDALSALADAARDAADRSAAAIEDALDFIVASNKRIAAMEVKTLKQTGKTTVKVTERAVRGVTRAVHRKAA